MKKLVYLLTLLLLLVGCGKEKKDKWEGPITEGLPDGVIAIETDGDTLTLEDIEKTIDSLEYYMGKYLVEHE